MCSTTSKVLCGLKDCLICFNRSFATHPKAEFWSKTNAISPHKIAKSSNKIFKFDCKDCCHEIEMILKNVIAGQWCAYCNSNKLCSSDECTFCFKKSFASQPMAESWSSRNTFKARDVSKAAEKKAFFNCKTCKHEFESQLYSLNCGTSCPYCSNQRLCSINDCKICLDKSCASHEMAINWSRNNIIKPREVFLKSNKKYLFKCQKCNHEYENTPNHYYNRDGSCPFCDNKKLCSNECHLCFNKSFASHLRVNCWSSKNIISPRTVFKGSESNYIFNCDECTNEFSCRLYNILNGHWCPYCKNKTEGKLLKYLTSIYKECKTQLRFDWCRYSKTRNIMPFDFGFEEYKLLIELDGRQHFEQIAKWDAPEITQLKDNEKMSNAIINGYSIIRIYQEEVWKDSYDWKTLLKNQIDQLIVDKTPKVIFISKADVYNTHNSKLTNEIIRTIVKP